MKALLAYVVAYPTVLLLAFHGTWLLGRLWLGRWPCPWLDDPKIIGPWVNVAHTMTELLLAAGLPAFVGAMLTLLYRAWREEALRKRWLFVCALCVACMVGSVLVLGWDPWGAVAWFMD